MLHFVKVDLEREREREKKICLSCDLYFFENKVCVCVGKQLPGSARAHGEGAAFAADPRRVRGAGQQNHAPSRSPP